MQMIIYKVNPTIDIITNNIRKVRKDQKLKISLILILNIGDF